MSVAVITATMTAIGAGDDSLLRTRTVAQHGLRCVAWSLYTCSCMNLLKAFYSWLSLVVNFTWNTLARTVTQREHARTYHHLFLHACVPNASDALGRGHTNTAAARRRSGCRRGRARASQQASRMVICMLLTQITREIRAPAGACVWCWGVLDDWFVLVRPDSNL